MCFKVSKHQTEKFRAKNAWIQCERTFRYWGKFCLRPARWGGTDYLSENEWQNNQLHVVGDGVHGFRCPPDVEKGGYMENGRGLYCRALQRPSHGKLVLKEFDPTRKPRKYDIPDHYQYEVSVWIHTKDILAVSSYGRILKAKRMWVGLKPPTKKQLSQKPIAV